MFLLHPDDWRMDARWKFLHFRKGNSLPLVWRNVFRSVLLRIHMFMHTCAWSKMNCPTVQQWTIENGVCALMNFAMYEIFGLISLKKRPTPQRTFQHCFGVRVRGISKNKQCHQKKLMCLKIRGTSTFHLHLHATSPSHFTFYSTHLHLHTASPITFTHFHLHISPSPSHFAFTFTQLHIHTSPSRFTYRSGRVLDGGPWDDPFFFFWRNFPKKWNREATWDTLAWWRSATLVSKTISTPLRSVLCHPSQNTRPHKQLHLKIAFTFDDPSISWLPLRSDIPHFRHAHAAAHGAWQRA